MYQRSIRCVLDDGISVGDEVGTSVLAASERGVSALAVLEGDEVEAGVSVGWGVSFTVGVFVG